MKKKRIIIVLMCVVLLWVIVGVFDFMLVKSYHKPIFCIGVDLADDGGSGRYVGLGYSFELEGGFMPEDDEPDVTSYRGYIFGKEVCRGFWERMLASVFPTNGITRITFHSIADSDPAGTEVPAEHMDAITYWLSTFAIDTVADSDVLAPGSDSISVKIEYEDGMVIENGLSTVVVEGTRYYMRHGEAPDACREIFNQLEIQKCAE